MLQEVGDVDAGDRKEFVLDGGRPEEEQQNPRTSVSTCSRTEVQRHHGESVRKTKKKRKNEIFER